MTLQSTSPGRRFFLHGYRKGSGKTDSDLSPQGELQGWKWGDLSLSGILSLVEYVGEEKKERSHYLLYYMDDL